MKLIPGFYTLEFSYVAQPPVDIAADLADDPILDNDAVEMASSGDETGGKAMDRKDLHERVERRRKQARRAQHNEERQTKSNVVDEKIEKTKDRLRRYQSKLEAAEKQACATSFSDWSLLCNLWFEGGMKQGSIRGCAKQVRPTKPATGPSIAAEPPLTAIDSLLDGAAADSSSNCPENGYVHVLEDSNWLFDDRSLIELRLFVKTLRGSVLGSETDLTDLSLKLDGEMEESGWCVGEVEGGSRTSSFSIKKDARVRFVMRLNTGPRCAHCCGLVSQVVSYGCQCQVVEYCSAFCQQKHEAAHRQYCNCLVPYASGRVGRAVARCHFTNQEFIVFWRATSVHGFTILVDHENPLGVAYEMHTSLLIDADTGLDMDFFAETQGKTEENILDVNVDVFQALLFNALHEGNAPLAATALNFLFRWWDNVEYLERYYSWFLSTFGGHSGHLIFVVNTLPEYVLFYRPRFEFASISVEAALKSSTASDFWTRLDQAKILLSDGYDGFNFGPKAQNIRTILVPEHQRQILHLLARIFIIMASRQPVDAATKLLERAVDCYKDAVEDDKARNDLFNMGVTCLHLSIVYRLFPDAENQTLANPMKAYALELIKKGEGKTPADRAPGVIKNALLALVEAEHDPSKATTPVDAVAVAGAVMNCEATPNSTAQQQTVQDPPDKKPAPTKRPKPAAA